MHKILLITILITSYAFANEEIEEAEEGKELHNESCVVCHIAEHNADFYENSDRKVKTLARLGGQVSMCAQAFSVGWFPEEEQAVVDYLNNTHYKFK